MKAKKTTPSRRRISFAVDREEIEINSDWVDAVMASPPASSVVPSPAPPSDGGSSESIVAQTAPVFFAPEENTATDEQSAPGERCTPVAMPSSVEETAAVVDDATVATRAPVEDSATVDVSTTDNYAELHNSQFSGVEETATGDNYAPVEHNATVALFTSSKDHRLPRRRPILRVTDGLTPGQFAVYSLMYEAGTKTSAANHSPRIYKGGYADLGRLTGLSKRGLQNIIAELQAKQVIQLHQQPGYHRTETSAYVVPTPEAVLRTWQNNGWRYALGKSKTLTR